MPDYIVKQHIDDFLRSDNLENAKEILGVDLDELQDVLISNPTNGQTLFRNDENLWVNRMIISSDILPALQGAEADPTRIGEEHMPEVVEFNYIRPGENYDSALPEGSITRQGSTLYVHDNSTPGGLPLGGSVSGDIQGRTSGVVLSLPFGATVSEISSSVVARPTGDPSKFFQRLGNIVIPGNKILEGNRLCFGGKLRIKSTELGSSGNSFLMFVPKEVWDAEVNLFTGVSPTFASIRVFDQTSAYDVVNDFWWLSNRMSLELTHNSLAATQNTTIPGYVQGYNVTTAEHYTVTTAGAGSFTSQTSSTQIGKIHSGEDFELVVVLKTSSTDTRYITFDIFGDCYTP